MNVLSLLTSLETRAANLEEEAKALRADAVQVKSILFGTTAASGDDIVPASSSPSSNGAAKSAPARKKLPSVTEIRAKAAEFGVNVDDLLIPGKKPTDAQKEDAIRRVYTAKKAAKAATPADPASSPPPNGSAPSADVDLTGVA